jgi:hypothetical protein
LKTFRKIIAADIQTKGFIAHDTEDTIVLFEEGKNCKYMEKCCVRANQRPWS